MPLLVKIGVATFGSVIAPVLVAVVLKLIDSDAPPVAEQAPQPLQQPTAQTAAKQTAPGEQKVAGAATVATHSGPDGAGANGASATDSGRKRKKRRTEVAPEQPNSPSETDFKPLFNGRDLTGWTAVDESRWSVEGQDRALVGQDRSGSHREQLAWIYTQREFADFRLRFELRMEPKTDSGITVRTSPSSKVKSRLSIQLSSFPDDSQMFPTGMIMGLRRDASHPHTMPKTRVSLRPPKDWNQVEIDCRGRRLQVTINGQVVQDVQLEGPHNVTDKDAKKYSAAGCIGLQSRSGRAEFRKIEIQELGSSAGN
jgi:hypothetical protein